MVRSNSAILLALIRKARSSELIRTGGGGGGVKTPQFSAGCLGGLVGKNKLDRGGGGVVKSLNMGLWERLDRAGFGKECWLGLEHG